MFLLWEFKIAGMGNKHFASGPREEMVRRATASSIQRWLLHSWILTVRETPMCWMLTQITACTLEDPDPAYEVLPHTGAFPSGPVAKTQCYQCRGHGFNFQLGNSEPTCHEAKKWKFIFQASQVALAGKNSPASAGDIRDAGSISRLGRSPGGGNGNPLQYSCLEHSIEKPGRL